MGMAYWWRSRNWRIKKNNIKMDILQQINQIPMRKVLDRLGIKYTILGSSFSLWEDKRTDGRRSNSRYANDFSWKGRASWEPFAFVKAYLKLSSKETFNRFSKNYWITGTFTPNTKTEIKKEKNIKLRYHRNW